MLKQEKPDLKLSGLDGNSFAILGRAVGVGKEFGWTKEQRKEFLDKATSGNRNHLLQVCMEYFNVK